VEDDLCFAAATPEAMSDRTLRCDGSQSRRPAGEIRLGAVRHRAAVYSLLSRELEFETMPFLADAGIGVMAWSPLAGGYLSGKYSREDPDGSGGRLSRFNFMPLDADKADRVVAVLNDVAKRHDTTAACAALAWVANQRGLASVMLGVSRASMLAANLAAASIVLTEDDLAALDDASKCTVPYPNWYNDIMADSHTAAALTRQ
jgi:aryl-alcohol dehydrogenase-like predicted oxidoreductase